MKSSTHGHYLSRATLAHSLRILLYKIYKEQKGIQDFAMATKVYIVYVLLTFLCFNFFMCISNMFYFCWFVVFYMLFAKITFLPLFVRSMICIRLILSKLHFSIFWKISFKVFLFDLHEFLYNFLLIISLLILYAFMAEVVCILFIMVFNIYSIDLIWEILTDKVIATFYGFKILAVTIQCMGMLKSWHKR